MTDALHPTPPTPPTPPTLDELLARLPDIRAAPRDEGRLHMIVRRPAAGEREILEEGTLDLREGLVGDDWLSRGSKRTPDGSAHPDMQIAIMGARAIAAVAAAGGRSPDDLGRDLWPLAGDQLFLDMDLTPENLPPGTRLSLGTATLQITDCPHNGCKKFQSRFGEGAIAFLASPEGKSLRLRGLYARVVASGTIRPGDIARKLVTP